MTKVNIDNNNNKKNDKNEGFMDKFKGLCGIKPKEQNSPQDDNEGGNQQLDNTRPPNNHGQRRPGPTGRGPNNNRKQRSSSTPPPPSRQRQGAPSGRGPNNNNNNNNRQPYPGRTHPPPSGRRGPGPSGRGPNINNNRKPRSGSTPPPPSGRRGPGPSGRSPNNNNNRKPRSGSTPPPPSGQRRPGGRAGGPTPAGRSPNAPRQGNNNNDPKRPRNKTGPGRKKVAGNGPPPGSATATVENGNTNDVPPPHNYDPSKWKIEEYKTNGKASYDSVGEAEEVKGEPIKSGIKKFKANPNKYLIMRYQTEMLTWPPENQKYTLVQREGTMGYKPTGISSKGWMTVLIQEYERCRPFKDDELPHEFRDEYTDNMSYGGKKLHNKKNKPIMPGRGMGIGDSPDLKIIGDVDPSDIYQGSVGDCWLLSGISSLAEFDGAIKKLFRKTKNLYQRPLDGPNQYIITYWDLSTWREVDIVIDERLPVKADGSGFLLGARPSEDAELWVCYLEKAFACHAGGWDKINGGQCTHAWAVMTGCKYQYTISKNEKTKKYYCTCKFNPETQQWNKHGNSPHDGDLTTYRCPWPAVGGGGDGEITQEELFMKMYAWDLENFIVGAGTSGTSDANVTDGMVDNHAYSVIECRDNVAGTEIDLLKVRNPWGKGEIEDGEFDDDGPGWDKYPQIKAELNPVVADDGIFWVTKKEFFEFFQTIYLSASNMTEFLED